jgi:hypothetical protein
VRISLVTVSLYSPCVLQSRISKMNWGIFKTFIQLFSDNNSLCRQLSAIPPTHTFHLPPSPPFINYDKPLTSRWLFVCVLSGRLSRVELTFAAASPEMKSIQSVVPARKKRTMGLRALSARQRREDVIRNKLKEHLEQIYTIMDVHDDEASKVLYMTHSQTHSRITSDCLNRPLSPNQLVEGWCAMRVETKSYIKYQYTLINYTCYMSHCPIFIKNTLTKILLQYWQTE